MTPVFKFSFEKDLDQVFIFETNARLLNLIMKDSKNCQ